MSGATDGATANNRLPVADQRRRSASRGLIRLAVSLAVLVVLAVVALVPPIELWNRLSWRFDDGTFTASSRPPHLEICGRRFYPTNEIETLLAVRAETNRYLASRPKGSLSPLHQVGSTPAGTPVLAVTFIPPPDDACTTVVYVNVSANSYQTYVLSGGP
jgi:hypothetical protein